MRVYLLLFTLENMVNKQTKYSFLLILLVFLTESLTCNSDICLFSNVTENSLTLTCKIRQITFNVYIEDSNGRVYADCLSLFPYTCDAYFVNTTASLNREAGLLKFSTWDRESMASPKWTCRHGSNRAFVTLETKVMTDIYETSTYTAWNHTTEIVTNGYDSHDRSEQDAAYLFAGAGFTVILIISISCKILMMRRYRRRISEINKTQNETTATSIEQTDNRQDPYTNQKQNEYLELSTYETIDESQMIPASHDHVTAVHQIHNLSDETLIVETSARGQETLTVSSNSHERQYQEILTIESDYLNPYR